MITLRHCPCIRQRLLRLPVLVHDHALGRDPRPEIRDYHTEEVPAVGCLRRSLWPGVLNRFSHGWFEGTGPEPRTEGFFRISCEKISEGFAAACCRWSENHPRNRRGGAAGHQVRRIPSETPSWCSRSLVRESDTEGHPTALRARPKQT